MRLIRTGKSYKASFEGEMYFVHLRMASSAAVAAEPCLKLDTHLQSCTTLCLHIHTLHAYAFTRHKGSALS